jgi:hypothetical protein
LNTRKVQILHFFRISNCDRFILSECSSSVNAFEFVLLNLRVVLGQFFLLVSKVVEGAFVALCVTMFGAEHVPTLAGRLHETHLLSALPAFVQVGLNIIWLGLTEGLKSIQQV